MHKRVMAIKNAVAALGGGQPLRLVGDRIQAGNGNEIP